MKSENKKPDGYALWPEGVRILYDAATEEAVEALAAIINDDAAEARDRLAAVQAIVSLGGPELEEDLRKKTRAHFGKDGQEFIRVITEALKDPNLSSEDRAQWQELLSRTLSHIPPPKSKA